MTVTNIFYMIGIELEWKEAVKFIITQFPDNDHVMYIKGQLQEAEKIWLEKSTNKIVPTEEQLINVVYKTLDMDIGDELELEDYEDIYSNIKHTMIGDDCKCCGAICSILDSKCHFNRRNLFRGYVYDKEKHEHKESFIFGVDILNIKFPLWNEEIADIDILDNYTFSSQSIDLHTDKVQHWLNKSAPQFSDREIKLRISYDDCPCCS